MKVIENGLEVVSPSPSTELTESADYWGGLGDDERGRDEQANDEDRPQPERKREVVRDRAHEEQPKPGDLRKRLGDLDEVLDSHDYPTTMNELVAAYGDYVIETQRGVNSLEEVLAPTENQTFDSADDARSRILGLVRR